jgi:hypothetical protein
VVVEVVEVDDSFSITVPEMTILQATTIETVAPKVLLV